MLLLVMYRLVTSWHVTNFTVTHYATTGDVQTDDKLVRVALVYDEHRIHFNLFTGTQSLPSNTQLVPGSAAVVRSTTTQTEYQLKLQFTGGLFGHFTQMIVFDFGRRPLLARKVVAELGDLKIQERVQVLRDKLTFNR